MNRDYHIAPIPRAVKAPDMRFLSPQAAQSVLAFHRTAKAADGTRRSS